MSGRELRVAEAGLSAWLFDTALPLWWETGADHDRGGFFEAIDGEGRPLTAPRRARVQARQIYVYATAGQLGWTGPWSAAVRHGIDYFLHRYARPDGLFRTLVDPLERYPLGDTPWLYDQAFALLAMAEAERAGVASLGDRARQIAIALAGWRWPDGGFEEPPAAYPRQSNPHMHLFEAALAWEEVDAAGPWSALADELAALAQSRFIDGAGAIHEYFQDGWRFADGVAGRIIEPGHQFEWAWLLKRWAERRNDDAGRAAALGLYHAGKRGIDPRRGVATQQLLDDGSIHDDVARLWPQTERIKAALIFEEPQEAIAAVSGLKLYLNRNIPGLWWDKLNPDGTWVQEPAPASSFYHIVCALAELRRLAL